MVVLPDVDGREIRLGSLWAARPAVIAFLRHYGCIFCRLPDACMDIVFINDALPIRHLDSMTVANTGSVSLSYDGDPRASYLVGDGRKITIRRVEYDRESEANDLLHSGLPHAKWLCNSLRAGRYCAPEGLDPSSRKE
jgi:hypothetical protein